MLSIKTISQHTMILLFTLCCLTPSAMAKENESFEQWLEEYGAWDQLEKEYSKDESKDEPQSILKRAEVYLNLNSPQEALEIIEMTPVFADNATEADRLWLGGQAHRAMGNLSKTVLWFSKAAEHLSSDSEIKSKLRGEPGLENIWQDVWLKLYWAYTANYTISKSSQKGTLNNIRKFGELAWRKDFWKQADMALNSGSTVVAPAPKNRNVGPDGQPLPPFISNDDTARIVKALATFSLGQYDQSIENASAIEQVVVRQFWLAVFKTLGTGTPDIGANDQFESENYIKARAFWQGGVLASYSTSTTEWMLGNSDSAPWTKFRNNLLSMPLNDARQAIDNELGSMLISEQTAQLLTHFKLALFLSSGDFFNSSELWKSIKKQTLPFSLRLAGAIFFKEDLSWLLPNDTRKAYALFPVLAALSGAAGHNVNSETEAPFWISAPNDKLEELSREQYPMDKLLLLAWWQQQFAKAPSIELAKRAAFLFRGTSLGNDSLIYLADTAVHEKKLQLGAYYLNQLDSKSLDDNDKMDWLNAKLRLELDSGRSDAGLRTYMEMKKLGGAIPPMTRLRMALLYQQKRNFKAAKQQLTELWNQRETLPTALQAETLFWLGEGEQALRNTEAALDYYLRLAWQYPQENIWALTAMYRASLIYEKRGKYETAKRLLGTVIKRADRKEQREAAKARLNAIDKKMGNDNKKKSTLVYPF